MPSTPSPECVQAWCVVPWYQGQQHSHEVTANKHLPESHRVEKPPSFCCYCGAAVCQLHVACVAMASLQDQNTVARRLILELREGLVRFRCAA